MSDRVDLTPDEAKHVAMMLRGAALRAGPHEKVKLELTDDGRVTGGLTTGGVIRDEWWVRVNAER